MMNTRGLLHDHPSLVMLVKRLGDLALVLVSAGVAFKLTYDGSAEPLLAREAVLLMMVLMLFTLDQFGLYRATRSTRLGSEIEVLSGGWLLSISMLCGYLWVRNQLDGPALKWLLLWLVAGWLSTVALRVLARRALATLRRHGFNQRTVVIAVAGELGLRVAAQLKARPDLGISVVGYFDDRSADRLPETEGVRVLGSVKAMSDFVAEADIDQVWVALPFRAETRIREILHALRHSTTDVCLVPDVFQFFILNQSLGEVAGIPLVALTASPMQGSNRLVKAVEDRVLALLILLLVSPLMLMVALAVRLDSPGPVLFKQSRRGLHDETIEVWKFRTMRAHYQAPSTYTLATRSDARVTAVGAFLRRTSLDELPQFFNVLQGQMSIVGPRPYPIEINDAYKDVVDRYMLRHKVKPGITGWAQVNGWRGALDTPEKMERRVQHDLFYIEHWSLWFDLKIIALTLVKGFVHENAY